MSSSQCAKLDAIAGTSGAVARFGDVGLGDSAIVDDGSNVTINEPLIVHGVSGNTGIALVDAGAGAYSDWTISSNSHTVGPSNRGALVFVNASDESTPRLWIGDDGLIGFGGISNPSVPVDTPAIRLRTGAAFGKTIVSSADGTMAWTSETPGFGTWGATASIGSATSYAINSYTLANASRASQTWSVELECEVVMRRLSDPTVQGRFSNVMLLTVTYDSSGNATSIKNVSDNGTAKMAQNNEQGLPQVNDCYIQGAGGFFAVYITKLSGGNAALAKTRVRVVGEVRLDNW